MTALRALGQLLGSTRQQTDFTRLLDSLGDVVLLLGEQGEIAYVNASWHALTGHAVEASLNRRFQEFIHPADAVAWQSHLHRNPNPASEPYWLRLLGLHGEVRWCEIRLQCLAPEQPFPLSATLCDITPQVRQEQRQQANWRSLQSLVNQVPAMIYRSRNNRDWTMEYVSEGCIEVTGYQAADMLHQPQLSYGSLIHPEDAGQVWDKVQHALRQDSIFELNYRLRHADGRWRKVQERGRGITSGSGEVLGVEGVILAEFTP